MADKYCRDCGGQGYIRYVCSVCVGSGDGRDGDCEYCKGQGSIETRCLCCEDEEDEPGYAVPTWGGEE